MLLYVDKNIREESYIEGARAYINGMARTPSAVSAKFLKGFI